MKKQERSQDGMALVLALLAIIAILGAMALVMGSVQSAKRDTDQAVYAVSIEEACKAGIDIGIEDVWNEYLLGRGNTTGNLASYRTFIDTIVQNNEDLNRNGCRDGNERDFNGNGSFESGTLATLITENDPRELESGAKIIGLTLDRVDDVTGVMLTIRATAQVGQAVRSASQTIRISGLRFAGFQFAVLANNINCILCHAEFRQLDVDNNDDPNNYGTFDRIKIAALESLLIRKDEADSRTAGTVYTRGRVYNKDGSLLSASGIASSLLKGWSFSNQNGKINQDPSTGAMSLTNLSSAGVDSHGLPTQFANLYMNYPTDSTKMTDGELPTKFPAPFPDDNGDRKVNPSEFQKYVNSANGSIDFDLPSNQVGGGIKAGVAYGVPSGSTYTGTSLPSASNTALDQLRSDGKYSGNLILVGSANDPIVIDNKVAVDGDLVITGPVKGHGQLMVSGNVYVMGDITYADGVDENDKETFGVAADGTENAFALEAGGNIMIGDYLTIRAKNDYVATKTATNKYDDKVNTDVWQGQFVHVDAASATATMSSGKTTAIGYFDPGVVDAGGPQGTTTTTTYVKNGATHTVYQQPEGMYSFTTAELTLFNRMERQKWAPPGNADYNANYYIPGYTPRYYRLRDGAPVYQYVVTGSTSADLKEHSVNYLSPGVNAIPEAQLTNATVLSLNPKNNWISENTLRQVWFQDEANRRAHLDSDGRNVWKFDGLLYTNNSIFGVVRGNARHKSATYGAMRLRGSIVCADLGLLIADNDFQTEYMPNGQANPRYSGLRLLYDKRVDAFLNVEDPTQVQFARLVYQYD